MYAYCITSLVVVDSKHTINNISYTIQSESLKTGAAQELHMSTGLERQAMWLGHGSTKSNSEVFMNHSLHTT